MDPAELHSDYLQTRLNDLLAESARARELPSLRQRLAQRLQTFVDWLEPTPQARSRDVGEFQKHATS